MPEHVWTNSNDAPLAFPNWSAIWAGTLTFVAIWSVFGLLGAAIFATLASAANPVANMSIGIGIWVVVLMVIAMFVAGRTAGRRSGGLDSFLTGTVTFGLSMVAALVVDFLGRLGPGTFATGGLLGAYGLGVFAVLRWFGFVALLLGWIAATVGASSAMPRRTAEIPSEPVRRVA